MAFPATRRSLPLPVVTAFVALLAMMPLAAAAGPANAARIATVTEPAKIYLVALGDNGQSGMLIGCGDSLIAVNIEVTAAPTVEGKIRAVLEKLFSLHDAYYGESGLYNTLYESNLTVDSVVIQGSTAGIYLSGTTGARGVCDDPRIEAQITQTVLQFAGLTNVVIILNGGPLADYRGPIEFPETGHAIQIPFLDYWLDNGALPVFGYPISDQLVEGGHRVQYLERQRFEHHPENASPYTILLGLLGYQSAERQGLLGTSPFQIRPPSANPNCEYVPETGHNLCYGFRSYWHSHGLDFGDPGFSYRESLMLFGYPISDEFVVDGMTVQYFQRARFEWHPENPRPYTILLGLLGVDVYQSTSH